jgi:hypothetical protein
MGCGATIASEHYVYIPTALQPLLDQLITAGFHRDPHGEMSRDALQSVGEDPHTQP